MLSDDELIYEPPATKNLSYHEILSMIKCRPDPCEFSWDILLQNQSVERTVNLVSKVTKKAYTSQSRHGLALGELKVVWQEQSFFSKKDYAV